MVHENDIQLGGFVSLAVNTDDVFSLSFLGIFRQQLQAWVTGCLLQFLDFLVDDSVFLRLESELAVVEVKDVAKELAPSALLWHDCHRSKPEVSLSYSDSMLR